MFNASSALVAIGFLIAARTLIAQNSGFSVESWTVADGLPSPTVVGLARAKGDFLWVGTNKGLARFDGLQFTTFTRENLPGLRSNYIQHMAAGPDSQLYIATWKGGLTIYSHGRARTFAKAEGMKSDVVHVVIPAGQDEAWFGTDLGYLYHYRNGSIAEVGSDVLPHGAIYGLAKAPDGTLWIGTGDGLFYLRQGAVHRYRPKVPLPVIGIFELAITESGFVFAGSDRGVFQIEGDCWRRWTIKDGLPSDRIQVMTTAPGDVLWVGTDLGVAQLVQSQARRMETPFCSVTALAFDAENSLWIGCTEGQHMLRLRQPVVKRLSLSERHESMAMGSLVEDETGAVWMGTAHGLIRWRNNKSTLYTRRDGLPTNVILGLSLARDGGVWIGTENGFAKWQGGKIQSFRTNATVSENSVWAIREDRWGNLWVFASNRLLRRRYGQTRFEEIPNIHGMIWAIREDSKGNIFAATRELGLIRISGDSQLRFTTKCGLSSNMVYDMAETANGDIWVATEGGLSRIRNSKCASVLAENGLASGRVIAVRPDSQGHLWLKTSSVTIALELEEANRVAERGGILTRFRILRDEDGFGQQLNTSTTNSMLLHSSGEMWFATLAGIGRVDPVMLRTAAPLLTPQVDSFASDTGEHDLTQPVVVRPGDLHLRFAYSAPFLIGAKSRDFRYRLNGFDREWQAGGKQRDAVYTSLPPGNYQFQVSVRRPFEPWSEASVPLQLRILPNFYQTWWWYMVLGLASIAVVLLGCHLRLITIRRQYALLMGERLRERSRLARELHDTLARGMVGIHIQIEAAQVLLDVEPGSVRKHLNNVETIAREALIETRSSITELRSEAAGKPALHTAIQEAVSNFADTSSIPLTSDISEDLPQFSHEMNHEISRFLEEALANVHLHSEARNSYVKARRAGKTLLLEVGDDGKGFEASASGNSMAGHFGITGMKERARRIKGCCRITSALGEGTRIVLEAPSRAGWVPAKLFQARFAWPLISSPCDAERIRDRPVHRLFTPVAAREYVVAFRKFMFCQATLAAKVIQTFRRGFLKHRRCRVFAAKNDGNGALEL